MNILGDHNIIANADDLGLRHSVNAAILQCFKAGVINSSSVITNSLIFDDTVTLIKSESFFKNIGVHVNLVEFKPLTKFNAHRFIDDNGNWKSEAVNNKYLLLTPLEKKAFGNEINAQIEKAISAGLTLVHLDSHCHIHTLPAFYKLFIKAAKKYNLKLRLAQTYNEGNYLTFLYRKWLNNLINRNNCAYTSFFEDVSHFVFFNASRKAEKNNARVEVMLHPDLDKNGNLTDHYQPSSMVKWLEFLNQSKRTV